MSDQTSDIETRLKTVLSQLLSISIEAINDDLSPDTIDTWDSVTHMNLVMALEEEFRIQFTEVQIVEMMNYAPIRNILKEQLVN